tara:strand:+ start:442 stop:987 length:546 start_codon:yes stop_codon:yes gene_type:complete
MNNTFITSDTFFGREGIINKAKRPFKNIDEMNETLVNNWNSVVTDDDTVYHLGNFAWNPIVANDILPRLNGKIIFMLGEYDNAIIDIHEYYGDVEVVHDQILREPGLKSVFCHWPLESWAGKQKGIFHFHGNTLTRLKTDLSLMNRVNVCTDNWSFTPQRMCDLYSVFDDWKNSSKKTQKK